MVRDVRMVDPDRPGGRHIVMGYLAFTDKGIVFLQIADGRKVNRWLSAPIILALFVAGIIPAIIVGMILESVTQSRWRDRFNTADIQYENPDLRLVDRLAMAPELLLVPLENVRKVTLSAQMILLNRRHGRRFKIAFAGPTSDRRFFREMIKAYSRAVAKGEDPVAACSAQLDSMAG